MVPIGDLRERVTIQSRTDDTTNGLGGGPVTWADVTTRWAKVEPLTGTERIQAAALQSVVSHRVTMRAIALDGPFDESVFDMDVFQDEDIGAPYRLRWKSLILEVQALLEPPDMRGFVIAECSQVQN